MVSLSDYSEFSICVPVYVVIILCIPMLMYVPGYIYIIMYICVCRYICIYVFTCIYVYVFICMHERAHRLVKQNCFPYSMFNPLCLQDRDLCVYPGVIHLLCCFRHIYTTTRPLAHGNFSDHGTFFLLRLQGVIRVVGHFPICVCCAG